MKSLKDAKIICSMMNRKAGYEKFKVIPSLCGCGSYDIVEIVYELKEQSSEHVEERKDEHVEERAEQEAEPALATVIPEKVTRKRRTKKSE